MSPGPLRNQPPGAPEPGPGYPSRPRRPRHRCRGLLQPL